jgi:ankyrin repeat protein
MNFDIEDSDGETPLIYSISSKHTFEMTKFLISKGADKNHKSRKRGWNPVYVAATLGTVECLEYLVSIGCDVNQPTCMDRTALTKAVWMARVDSLKVLLKHPQIDLEWKANQGRTAL